MVKIAHTVYTVEEIKLQDGTDVILRPANIKTLRAANKQLKGLFAQADNDEMSEEDKEDFITDGLVGIVSTCLKKQIPALNDHEYAEEVLDLETIYKIIEICLGVKLNDPKLQEAAMRAMAAAASSSQT